MHTKQRLFLFVAIQIALSATLIVLLPRLPLDDAYIFLTYARHLATAGQFSFNPGEVSYGFSSPAYVMVLAAAARLTSLPVTVGLAHCVGLVMCALASACAYLLWEETSGTPSRAEMLLGSVILSGPWFFAVWFVCGMETGFAVLATLGFLLWLVKLRSGSPRLPWMILGALSAMCLATTRLESGLYLGSGLVIAFFSFSRSPAGARGRRLELFLVGAAGAGAELVWLLFAHRTFGTYMPWTGTARLIYYFPTMFQISGDDFYTMHLAGRSLLAARAIFRMAFGGPLKLMLIALPVAAAVLFLRVQPAALRMAKERTERDLERAATLRWVLGIALFGMLLQMAVFSYLFPLVQNRHLAPYLAGIWILVSLPLARTLLDGKVLVRIAGVTVFALLWVGGALQYRTLGDYLRPLFAIANLGGLTAGDRIAAEPIGVLSFETPAYIIDVGGLTRRDLWPRLSATKSGEQEVKLAGWDIDQGATQLLLPCIDVPTDTHRRFGTACIVTAKLALGDLAAGPNPQGN